jgi:hypothetical protein
LRFENFVTRVIVRRKGIRVPPKALQRYSGRLKGIVGEALVAATLEQMSKYNRPPAPHLGHWGGVLAIIPFGTASIAGYGLKFESVRNPKVLVAATAMLGAGLGVLVSQHMPVFGGIEMEGEPWSEARLSLVPGHVIMMLVLGAAVGGFVVWRTSSGAKQ